MDFWLEKPTVIYCEKSVAGIVARPGYALSNLPYILAGLFIIIKNRKSRFSVVFGLSSIIIGVCSLLYDVSYTFLSQYFDWLGMFLFVLLLSLVNFRRIVMLSDKALALLGIVILIGYLPLSFLVMDGTIFFGLGVLFLVLSEVFILLKNQGRIDKLWLLALLLFLFGVALRYLDAHGVICDPSNLFNGRGLFHYLSTGSILLLHAYYKKIIPTIPKFKSKLL